MHQAPRPLSCHWGKTRYNNSDQQTLSISTSALRLRGFQAKLSSPSSQQDEAARPLLTKMLGNLRDAEGRALRPPPSVQRVLGETSLTAVTRRMDALTLDDSTTARDTDGGARWFPSTPKLARRLVGDVSEKIDAFMQLVHDGGSAQSDKSGEAALSVFWLGVVASSLADAPHRTELARYAAGQARVVMGDSYGKYVLDYN